MNEKREKQKEEEKVNKDRKMRSETIILRPEVPLLERLSTYAASDAYPFHMPGHKRQVKMGITSVPNPFSVDITEIDGFDNLHHAEDILKESMNSAAAVYGADRSWYLVNGSTCGILAAIAAAVKPGEKILMARNSHKSAYHAVVLNQLEPVYLYPEEVPEFQIPGEIEPEQVERALLEHPEIRAVFVTSPTYEGIVSDIQGIAATAHRHGAALIVDEAHGAHLPFGDGNYFPDGALQEGADLVIQSLHKTLPSLTQTAILHLKSQILDAKKVEQYLSVYQSSSPSYILMASIDACMDTMAAEGKQMFRDFTRILEQTRKRLSVCKYIRLVDPVKGKNGVFDYDRSKLVFSTRASLLSGSDLYHILLDRYHIQMEMESENYVLAIASVGDREEGFERLCQAIEELDQEQADLIKAGIPAEENKKLDTRSMHFVLTQMMSMADAMEAPTEKCPLEESIGRISAEFAYLYPPGIPLITPGEQITGQFIRNMRIYMDKGLYLQGLEDYTNKTILVVEQQPQSTKEQDEEIHG